MKKIFLILLFSYSLVISLVLFTVSHEKDSLLDKVEEYETKYDELQEEYDRLITSEILPDAETNEPVPETKEEKPVAALGSSRSNPIVVTATQFANEINSNTDAAKTKYNGKWVQITGKVLSANNVSGMTNFYLYGERGGSGLKVVCWVNKEVLKPFDYRGETHTFIGQLREITTVNATEIGDCEIVE